MHEEVVSCRSIKRKTLDELHMLLGNDTLRQLLEILSEKILSEIREAVTLERFRTPESKPARIM
jgi:hypothetical protein